MDNTNRETLGKFAKSVKDELAQWRESMDYYTLETFVGCLLARFRQDKLITSWEESILRQKLED